MFYLIVRSHVWMMVVELQKHVLSIEGSCLVYLKMIGQISNQMLLLEPCRSFRTTSTPDSIYTNGEAYHEH